MSNAIEQRVVEMRFDNSHFEKNVSTTMTTLDKLKQKLNLNFSGTSKALDDVSNSAKKIDMNPLGNAVESVSAKFSALQVMGVTALANITNSAINAGKNIVKSLTITPVTTGFNEYELKMNSIQTIMAGTGESLATVNQYLNALNEYSDKTIYSFQDMTTNIGKFTNAGVKLEDAVAAIKGISNEAAVSGASASQASHAMYNLAQALSAGYVKLIDWKSIETTQMATMEFKQELIDTAVAVGTLTKVGDGMYETLEGKSMNATKNFNDTLQDQWMTSEVLITTLKKYSDETTEIGAKATEAATKVKTFTQLMDTLKESAQSGWAQSWELIVGDFEEARAFFTELSDIFGGILGKSADRRNSLISETMMSNWDKLIQKVNDAGVETSKFEESIKKVVGEDKLKKIVEDFGSIEEAAKKGAISSKDLQKAFDSLVGSKADDEIASFVNGLKEIESVLRRGNAGEEVKKLQTALDELGYDLGSPGIDGILGPITEKAIKEFQEAEGLIVDGVAGPKTIAALEKAGTKLAETTENVDDLKLSAKDLINEITKKSGRELLLDSLMNVIKAIQRPLGAVGEAMRNIFSVSPEQLYNGLEKLNKFTSSFVMKGLLDVTTWDELNDKISDLGIDGSKFVDKLTDTLKKHGIKVSDLEEEYGSLAEAFNEGVISADVIKETLLGFDGISESLLVGGEAADKLRRTFEGLFAAIDAVLTIVSVPFKLGFNVITKVLGRLGLSVLDITAEIGDSFVEFRDKIDGVIDNISTVIVDGVGKWISEFKETQFFKTCADWIKSASETISGAIEKITKAIDDFDGSALASHLTTFGNFVSRIATNLANSDLFVAIIDGICNAFSKLKDFFTGFKLPELNLDSLTNIAKYFKRYDGKNVSGFANFISSFGSVTKDIVSFNFKSLTNKALEKFANFWIKSGDIIKEAFESCKKVGNAIKEFIFGTEDVNLQVIMDAVTKFLWIVTLIKTIKLLDTIVSPFENITSAFEDFAAAMKWNAVTAGLKAMALALGVFTVCILILSSEKTNMKKAWSAAGMMMALMVVMGGVVTAVALAASKIDGGVNAAGAAMSLLLMIGSLVLLVHAIRELDDMQLKHPVETFLRLAGLIAGLAAGIAVIKLAGGSSFGSVAAILTLMAALKMIVDIVELYDGVDWHKKTKGIRYMTQMLFTLAGVVAVASIFNKGSFSGLAMTLLAMIVSLKLLVKVIDEYANIPDDQFKKGRNAIMQILGILSAFTLVAGFANKATVLEKGQKAVGNFVGLAGALIAVVAAIAVLGYMAVNHEDILMKGGYAVGQILILFTGMLFAVGRSCAGLKIGSIVTMMLGFGALLIVMAGLIYTLKSVGWESSLSSAAALSLMMLSMAGVMKTLNKVPMNAKTAGQWIGALAGLSAIVIVLAHVLNVMKDIPWQSSVGNAAALVILLGGMTLVLNSLMGIDTRKLSNAKMRQTAKAFAGMIVIFAALGLVLAMMSALNTTDAVPNAIAISILAGALTLCMYGLSLAGKVAMGGNLVSVVGTLVTVGLLLGVLVAHLSNIKDTESARQNAITAAGLGIALSAAAVILAAASLIAPTAVTGAVYLATLAGLLGILVWHLSNITGVDTARENAITVSGLAVVLSACTIALALASLLAPVAIVGAGLLVTLAVVLAALVWGLSKIKDVDTARQNTITIVTLLTSLTSMIVVLAALGNDALTAVDSLANVVKMVEALAVFAAAVGFLSEHNDKLSKFVDVGLELFKKVAKGMGEIVLAFTGGLGLGSDLGTAAENLSAFAEKLQPFVDAMSAMTDDGIGKITQFSEAVNVLAGIDVSDGELSSLGSDLSTFAGNAETFITTIGKISPDTATSAESFCNAIATLSAASVNVNTDNFTEFGTAIDNFAVGMQSAANAFAGFSDDDVQNINRAADAAGALADLNNAIPKEGGLWQDIAGTSDIAEWGEKISAFADSLVAFNTKIVSANISTDKMTQVAEAATAVADLNAAIPKDGGDFQEWFGGQNIAEWGTKIAQFADSLIAYNAAISGSTIDVEAIKNSATAVSALAEVNASLTRTGGSWQQIIGEKDMATFGAGLKSLGEGLSYYCTKATGIDDTKIEAIGKTKTAVEKIIEVVNLLPQSGDLLEGLIGEKDPLGFGTGISALATGVQNFCTSAATIAETDTSVITDVGTVIDEISTIVNDMPEIESVDKAAQLRSAVDSLKIVCSSINTISTSEYDFSGVETVKTAINKLSTVFNDTSIDDLSADFSNAQQAVNSASSIATTLVSLNGNTYGGVDTLKGALDSLAKANVDGVIDAFSGKSAELSGSVRGIVTALSSGLSSGGETVNAGMTNLISGAIRTAKMKAPDFEPVGKGWATALANGMKDNKDVKTSGKQLASDAITAAGSKTSINNMTSAGWDVAAGFARGIRSGLLMASTAGKAIAMAAYTAAKLALDINSPSKVFRSLGYSVPEGLAMGIDKYAHLASNSATSMVSDAIKTTRSTISRIADSINSDIDTQPTIRPVLDLSDVESGAGRIGNLLGSTPIGVSSNLSAITTMMGRRSQNGANDDVVYELRSLRNKLDNLGNTTYQVNGITYDDGSNMSRAVSDMIRYARIERRV